MEKSQREVTDKIRQSIKDKLKEMNTFVDDELPDYIMILIANKRSKHHMEKDLSLFLGSQTEEFTDWLWNLVNAFKGGSMNKNSKTSDLEAQVNENSQIKEMRAEEDDFLNYDPAEQGESLLLEETNEPSPSQQNVVIANVEKPKDSKIPFSDDDDTPENSYLLLRAADKPHKKTTIKKEKIDPAIVGLSKSSTGKQKSAKVYPMQRLKEPPNSVSAKESYLAKSSALSKPEYSGVASVVCFTQKKFGGAAAALQANKLLLRAVNDATKSVLSGRDVNDYYKPTPIKELVEDKKEILSEVIDTVKNPVRIKTHEQGRIVKYEIQETAIENNESSEQTTSRHIVSLNPEMDIYEQTENTYPSVQEPVQTSVHQPLVETSIDQPLTQVEEESTVTPHFIVTLDGVDFASLKRKRSVISDDEPMEIDENEEDFEDDTPEQSKEKKQKIAERCKYWPACKNNTDCAYHHPTKPCQCFPNCKYGDKCLYIHPNCKFDALCSKRDCPYTHCSIRKYPVAIAARKKPRIIPKAKVVCKYYPRCTAKPCPFIHPKLCKFGTQCRAPKCSFGHFQIPNRDQLKWKAV